MLASSAPEQADPLELAILAAADERGIAREARWRAAASSRRGRSTPSASA